MNSKAKKYNKIKHSLTMLTPMQASLKGMASILAVTCETRKIRNIL